MTPPPRREITAGDLWRMLDLITPMALRVAATLRLADLIREGHGALGELAARAGADADTLGRLLRYLSARGVFAEPSPGHFALTERAEFLTDEHPSGLRRWVDLEGFGGRMDLSFFELLATVRAGRPPEAAHKASLPANLASSYDAVMEAQSRAQAPAIVAAYDWSGFEHVADIGGGTGNLLAEVLRAAPRARGTLVELLEDTAERARRYLHEAGVGDRCDVVAGDALEVMPRGADAYVWKFVLHSLDDTRAAEALRRCREAARPDSRILILERTVASGDHRAVFTTMDLHMLLWGQGGRERTLDEFSALAERAGLALRAATPTPAGVHIIELGPTQA
ncbi:MAG: methyltransferase domain-containing protein [Polyangiaceae bacterium]|jgi:2,7-dihydroxy-5-methyl-1-naphthoate 7-O-methyltransferase|nr:methyltransferase domain-containing protein [Polyangiaceae bacterium]